MKRLLFYALLIGGAFLVIVVLAAIQTIGKPATPIVSQKHGFQLASPGEGWTLVSEAEAQKVLPQAACAAMHQKSGLTCFVLVEQGTGDLDTLLRQAMDQANLQDKKEGVIEKTEVQGRPAVRGRVSGKTKAENESQQVENLIFIADGRIYRLTMLGKDSPATADGSAFLPFINAFSLLSKAPDGKGTTNPPPETKGTDKS